MDADTPAVVKNEGPGSEPRRARARIPAAARWLLLLAGCALLAGGAYYAWRAGFGQDDAKDSVITAVAQRGNLEDTAHADRGE